MHYLIVAVIFVLLVMGMAWVVAATAAAIAVPSIFVLRPIHAMLGPGSPMSVLYVVLHAAVGALIGLWLGRRGAAATGLPPRPLSDPARSSSAPPAATGGSSNRGGNCRRLTRSAKAHPWRSVALGLLGLGAAIWAPWLLLFAGAFGVWIWYHHHRS